MDDIEILVTGGSGLIGRWLLAALSRRETRIAVLLRDAARRGAELAEFVASLGGVPERITFVEGDVERNGLGLDTVLGGVRDVYHLAARFAFGLGMEEARRTNVGGTLNVVDFAAELPRLRRIVYVGGYRMTRPPKAVAGLDAPFDRATAARVYGALGAYEASKHESYLAIRRLAKDRALPLTIVHPSAVIGDSRTGRTTQVTGLGAMVERLHDGTLPALVGTQNTFVPVVTVDHLAEMLATAPLDPETLGQELVVLDPATPVLPGLLRSIAASLGVPAPARMLPVGLVAALPRALTGVDPETLHFLSEDRYDTSSAEAHAARMGHVRPELGPAVGRWVDGLISTRFTRSDGPAGRLHDGTFVVGDPTEAEALLLHGLPWNGDAWDPVITHLDGWSTARVDLPGLGRSAAAPHPILDHHGWLDRLLSRRTRPIVLVGASVGAQVAIRYAHARPERVRRVVAIAPAFLQAAPPWWLRIPTLVGYRLRRATQRGFEERFVGASLAPGVDRAIASALADLRRPGVARRTACLLAEAARADRRRRATLELEELRTPVTLITGSDDPLLRPRAGTVTIAGARHHLHVTHPQLLAEAIRAACP